MLALSACATKPKKLEPPVIEEAPPTRPATLPVENFVEYVRANRRQPT